MQDMLARKTSPLLRARLGAYPAVALVGPADRIRDRLQAWKAAGEKRHVGSLLAGTGQPEALRLLAEEVL